MKILCVIDSLGSGGAQRQLVELAKGFKEQGYFVSFLVYHEENFFKDQLDEAGVSIHLIYEKNYLRRLLKMRMYIRSFDADIVLSFLEGANFMCEVASWPTKNWKLIVGERSANPNILKSFKLRAYRFFHVFADYVVANSHSNMKMVKAINPFLSPSKCKVIYNMVDTGVWSSEGYGDESSNEKLNLVVFASHQYLKNAKGLVNAVNVLSIEDQRKIEIHWYGGLSLDNSFQETLQLVKSYGLSETIKFFPPTEEVKDKILNAHVVGLFSFYEGLPNVVCEAMMLGKPIIVSNVSDIPLLIDKDMMCDPTSPLDIAKLISRIISLDKAMLGEYGKRNRLKAKQMFTKELVLNSYIKLFTK